MATQLRPARRELPHAGRQAEGSRRPGGRHGDSAAPDRADAAAAHHRQRLRGPWLQVHLDDAYPCARRDLRSLGVKSILYDDGNTTRRRLIVDDFIRGHRKGFLVHIGTDPWTVVADGRKSPDPLTQGRAEAVASVLQVTTGLDPETTKTPANAGTVLYPLSRGRIGSLIQRAYALSMAQGHVWHNLPMVDIPPLADFVTLESGSVPKKLSP